MRMEVLTLVSGETMKKMAQELMNMLMEIFIEESSKMVKSMVMENIGKSFFLKN